MRDVTTKRVKSRMEDILKRSPFKTELIDNYNSVREEKRFISPLQKIFGMGELCISDPT